MATPIPGAVEEWVPSAIAPNSWERIDHPENGVISLMAGLTFPEYYAQRMLPTEGEILRSLPKVEELLSLLKTQDGPMIDAWAEDNANSTADIRVFIKTLLKTLSATGL